MDRKKNNIKTSTLPKAIYRFNAITINVPNGVFHRTRRNNTKIYMEQPKKNPNKYSERTKLEVSCYQIPNYTVRP